MKRPQDQTYLDSLLFMIQQAALILLAPKFCGDAEASPRGCRTGSGAAFHLRKLELRNLTLGM